MYYDQSPTIIEPNNIVALRSSQVETGADGITIATLVVELDTSRKGYAPTPLLYLTDGVSPRLLEPKQPTAPTAPTATLVQAQAQASTMTDAIDASASATPEAAATESAAGNGKKSRMSRDERGSGV